MKIALTHNSHFYPFYPLYPLYPPKINVLNRAACLQRIMQSSDPSYELLQTGAATQVSPALRSTAQA